MSFVKSEDGLKYSRKHHETEAKEAKNTHAKVDSRISLAANC